MLNASMVLSIPLGLTLMTALMPYDRLAVVASATALGSQEEVTQLLGALKYAFYGLAIINGFGVATSALRGPRPSSGRASDYYTRKTGQPAEPEG
jgi:hypothetical protein